MMAEAYEISNFGFKNYLPKIRNPKSNCPLPAVGAAHAVGEFFLNHRARFVDGQRTAGEVLAIECLNRLFGVFVTHRDETKTFRASGIAICNDADGFDGADFLEKTAKFFFRRPKRQIPNINFL